MHWKGRACGFWFLAAERKWRLVEPKTGSRRKDMQLAGSKDGGWVYTEQDPGVQNGNSGSIDREPKLRHAPLQPGGEDGNLAYILE